MDYDSDPVSAGSRAPVVALGPDLRYTGAAAAGLLVAALVAVFAGDPAGRLLAAIAAVILLCYVVGDLVFRPRLVASGEGLRIRSPLLRAEVPWSAVTAVRADVRSRYGLRSTTLEVDIGDTIAVFTRRTLGTDPETAAGLLQAFRP